MELPKEFTGDGLYVHAKAGIYAIVNPIGEIYIGQSMDIEKRIRSHKKHAGHKCRLLKYSMFNHGRQNHKYYLVMDLDDTADQAILYKWEKFFIKKFTEDGYIMLNANAGGCGGKKGNPGSADRKLLFQLSYDKYNQPL